MNPIGDPLIFLRFLPRYAVNHHGIFFRGLQLILRLTPRFGWQETPLVTEDYAISKRLSRATHTRCREQGIGFEPIVFDHAGGMNEEGKRILDSLCKAVDGPNGRQVICTKYIL